MADAAVDILIGTIKDWGVEVIFSLSSAAVNSIMEALCKGQKTDVVLVPNAMTAILMACAYVRYTSKPTVCLAAFDQVSVYFLDALVGTEAYRQPMLAFCSPLSPFCTNVVLILPFTYSSLLAVNSKPLM
jgi:thiamine pyrophosphate-dependent acetolactate synthase large subunit-like protein